MYNKFQQFLIKRISKNEIVDTKDMYLHLITFAAVTFCLLAHVFLFGIFLVAKMPDFVTFNLISILVYIISMYLQRTHRYKAVSILVTVDVCAYTMAFCLLTGNETNTYVYFFLMTIMQISLPYARARLRGIVVMAIFALAFSTFIINLNRATPVILTQHLSNILAVSNLFILFFGTIIMLVIGDAIKQSIEKLNKSRLAQLTNLAYTDPLTGLYNRRHSELYFSNMKSNPQNFQKCCVAILDIDDFKAINDTYGHPVGDEVLINLSHLIRDTLRKSDVVFRWGGEEFLIVLEDVELSSAYTVLEKIRRNVESTIINTIVYKNKPPLELRITITAGAAVLDPAEHEKSIEICDANMYKGKQTTKNVVIVEDPRYNKQNGKK